MKTYKTIPTGGEIFNHESGIAKLMLGISWFFVFVSAGTVTSAWTTFLEKPLAKTGDWAYLVIALVFVVVCLVEIFIFELSKYFHRSIIYGYHKGEHFGQFATATLLLALLLSYSFYMSQKATKLAMISASKGYEIVDTKEIDQEYDQKIRTNALALSNDLDAVDSKFSDTERAISRKYTAIADSLQVEYQRYEARGAEKYRTKLTILSRGIAKAETDKQRELAAVSALKSQEISRLQDRKFSQDSLAGAVKENNLAVLLKGNLKDNEDLTKLEKVFSSIISIVAAMSVIFVFILARFVELFYKRAGIKRSVFLENWDLRSDSPLLALLKFPFVAVSRVLSVKVASWYDALPNPPAPPNPEQIYDISVETQAILNKQGGVLGNYVPGSTRQVSPVPLSKMIPTPASAPSPKSVDTGSLKDSTFLDALHRASKTYLSSGGDSEEKPGDSKASNEISKPASMPEGLEAEIVRRFQASPKESPVYELIRANPADYSVAFSYIEKLKKTARNCLAGSLKPGGKESTRENNRKRLDATVKELERLLVQSILKGTSITFEWMDLPERA